MRINRVPAPAACIDDTDCKSDRRCVGGACTWPSQQVGGRACTVVDSADGRDWSGQAERERGCTRRAWLDACIRTVQWRSARAVLQHDALPLLGVPQGCGAPFATCVGAKGQAFASYGTDAIARYRSSAQHEDAASAARAVRWCRRAPAQDSVSACRRQPRSATRARGPRRTSSPRRLGMRSPIHSTGTPVSSAWALPAVVASERQAPQPLPGGNAVGSCLCAAASRSKSRATPGSACSTATVRCRKARRAAFYATNGIAPEHFRWLQGGENAARSRCLTPNASRRRPA